MILVIAVKARPQGSEENCVVACPYIYEPVCAYNGEEYKLFGNECFMRSANECDRQGISNWFEK